MIATASEMKNGFGQYLKHVTDENGEIVITKNNVRVARLVPYVAEIEKYFSIQENVFNYDYGKKYLSYEEFLEISSKTTARLELINGELYVMETPNFEHQRLLGDLYVMSKSYFQGKKCIPILAPFDVTFRKKNLKDPDVCQPDMVVLCDHETTVTEKGRYMGIPSLVVEILSPSTRSRDLASKLNTYMLSGVKEYWVLDPDQKSITQYVFEECGILKMETVRNGETLFSQTFDGFSIELCQLFT